MKRLLVGLAVFALVAAACQQIEEEVEPTPDPLAEITDADLAQAVLTQEEVGEGWTPEEAPAHSTVQIGGRVGPGNLQEAEAQANSAFEQVEGPGYVSNSVFLVSSEEVARSVMAAHRQADESREWVQDRAEGGRAAFTRTGRIADLPALGDDMYTATLDVVVTDPEGRETQRQIEYIVYRVERILAFTVAQDVPAGTFARRQEQKVVRLIS